MNRSLWLTALVALALAVAACQPVLPVEQAQSAVYGDIEVFNQGAVIPGLMDIDMGPDGNAAKYQNQGSTKE